MTGRYDRQKRFQPFGENGQDALQAATVAIIGMGALGSASAELLTRAGIGTLILVDRDVVDTSNLSRQALYTTDHALQQKTKVEAAYEVLTAINPEPRLQVHALDLGLDNAPSILSDATLVLDGTDNFETRYLLNDLCLKFGLPWVYAGVVGASGMVTGFWPDQGCMRCLFPEPPAPGETETCDTAGVLAVATRWAATLQVSLAMKFLRDGSAPQGPFQGDLWNGDFRTITSGFKNPDCPACGKGHFEFLLKENTTQSVHLCGRNTVQIKPPQKTNLDLKAWIKDKKDATCSRFAARWVQSPLTLHLFRDGRALIEGTEDVDAALSFYRKWVGL